MKSIQSVWIFLSFVNNISGNKFHCVYLKAISCQTIVSSQRVHYSVQRNRNSSIIYFSSILCYCCSKEYHFYSLLDVLHQTLTWFVDCGISKLNHFINFDWSRKRCFFINIFISIDRSCHAKIMLVSIAKLNAQHGKKGDSIFCNFQNDYTDPEIIWNCGRSQLESVTDCNREFSVRKSKRLISYVPID